MEDDNKLVTLEQLNRESDIKTMWDNEEFLKTLNEQMDLLVTVKFTPYNQDVMQQFTSEILNKLGWETEEKFKEVISNILNGVKIPLALRTKDKNTGKLDFWLQRCVINVVKNPNVIINNILYSRKDVLLSKQFNDHLKKYLKETYKDMVQFWCFSGSITSGEQTLDLSKFSNADMKYLHENGDDNVSDLIMFQMKKRIPEVMVSVPHNTVN
jgi:hypothetical protein